MTEPHKYSDAEMAQLDAELDAEDDSAARAAKAAKVRQSRRKTIVLTLSGVGGLIVVAGAMAFVAATRTPAPKPYDSECGAVGCGGTMPGPRISVPSPGVIGMPTMVGVAVQQHRDYDPLVDATVLTDSPADAISKLAATFKPKAGKRYKVEVKVTQDE
jgi:hypothetical protein